VETPVANPTVKPAELSMEVLRSWWRRSDHDELWSQVKALEVRALLEAAKAEAQSVVLPVDKPAVKPVETLVEAPFGNYPTKPVENDLGWLEAGLVTCREAVDSPDVSVVGTGMTVDCFARSRTVELVSVELIIFRPQVVWWRPWLHHAARLTSSSSWDLRED